MVPLRICAITFDWYPFDLLVRRTAEAAANAGYISDVICLQQPEQTLYEEIDGVHVHRIPMNRSFGSSLPQTVLEWTIFLIQAGLKVADLHRKHPYHVVHVHNMPDYLVFSALFPKLMGAKVILEVQDVTPELMAAKAKGRLRSLVVRLATMQERVSTSFADYVVTVGWPFEELLLKRGVPHHRLSNIINSADPKLFPAERRTEPWFGPFTQERPMILMYHGTLAERNGLDTAIRALAKALKVVPHIRLDIQGRGEAIPYLKHLAKELDVEDRVIFTSVCPSDKLVDFVVHGDVGIIPYRSDGFMDLVLPTKAYEFAWMHRPIIASETPAIRSMFRAGSVSLCEPSNADEFAQAIIDLYQHPEKRKQMIESAAEDYNPFQWEGVAAYYQKLLLTLAQQKKVAQMPFLKKEA